jgi:hypothetical protein
MNASPRLSSRDPASLRPQPQTVVPLPILSRESSCPEWGRVVAECHEKRISAESAPLPACNNPAGTGSWLVVALRDRIKHAHQGGRRFGLVLFRLGKIQAATRCRSHASVRSRHRLVNCRTRAQTIDADLAPRRG